ncbi:MAG: hypothetical protein ACREIA_13395 [Opitutaceae bacterium]
MSLINDALKKAQSMHPPAQGGGLKLASKPLASHPAAAPAFPAPLATTHGNPGIEPHAPAAPKSRRPRAGLILAIAGAVFAAALCVLGGAAVMLWKSGSEQIAAVTQEAETPPAPAPIEAAPPAVAETTPIAEPVDVPAVEAPAVSVAFAPPSTEPLVSTHDAEQEEPAADIEAAVAESDPGAAAQAVSAAPAQPRDPKLQAYALGIRVAGIRTGENPKALMNDRVYSIGEYISPEHDLRLKKVEERLIELEDSHGNVYEVRF